MSFTLPWALWTLLAIPILIGIYLFRRRFKPRLVSALFLWKAPGIRTGGGHKISKLESSLLLFLEILIAALLAMAAAAPGCRQKIIIHHVAVILDDSASMQARVDFADSASSPRNRAIEKLRVYLKEHVPFSCTLIISGSQPRLLANTITNLRDFDQALEQWQPKQALHSKVPALQLARQIVGKNGNVLLLTDSPPPKGDKGKAAPPEGVDWWSFGTKLENTGFVSASRYQDLAAGKEEIFALVRHSGSGKPKIQLVCREAVDDGQILVKKQLDFTNSPEKKISFEIPHLVKIPLQLTLTQEDALAIDNSVLLAAETLPRVRVAIKLKDSQLDKLIEGTLKAVDKEVVLTDKRAQLLITDQESEVNPARHQSGKTWIVNFIDQESSSDKTKLYYGPYVIAKQHPICRDIFLEGIRWAAPKSCPLAADAIPLISCRGQTLLAERLQFLAGNRRYFRFSLFPRNSNLQKTPAWPMLIHNLVQMRARALPGFRKRNFRTGEKALGNYYGTKKLRLENHSTSQVKDLVVDAEGNCQFSSQNPGAFQVVADDEKREYLSFNFLNGEESDLTGSISGKWESDHRRSNLAKPTWRDEAWVFLLFALALVMIHLYLVKKREVAA